MLTAFLIYLMCGVVVLIVAVSRSHGLSGGSPLLDLAVALFVIWAWPVVIFAM